MNAPLPMPGPSARNEWDKLPPFAQIVELQRRDWHVSGSAEGISLTLANVPDGIVALIATGKPGEDALRALQTHYGKLPRAPLFGRPGARVRLFRVPDDVRLPAASDFFRQIPGVEIAASGEISIPESVGADQVRLTWHAQGHVSTTDPPALPTWLSDIACHVDDARRAGDRVRAAMPAIVAAEKAEARELVAGAGETGAAALALSDVGNAERLARDHGAGLRWVEAWGAWLVWNGARWERDVTGEVMRRAIDSVRRIALEAVRSDGEAERRAILKHAIKSEGAGSLRAMVSLTQSQPGQAVAPDGFDADPWLFNCLNGTLDLRTGELRPHNQENLCTKIAPVAYDPLATCPTFDAFLERVQPDPEVRACLMRVIGYSLTGVIREHVLPIHHGTGRNGKGTLRDAVLSVMGDYATEVPSTLLMSKDRDAHPTEKMVLKGARFASASETAKAKAIDEAQVKLLTGGDPITARLMGRDFVTFLPTHKLWLSTNHKPIIRELSPAMWCRLLLFQWSVSIPAHEQDTGLVEKLRAEASGILNRFFEGLRAWKERGIDPPHAVRAATDEYRASSDPIGDFLAEHTTTQPAQGHGVARAMAKHLLDAYTRWAAVNGQEAMTSKALGDAMGERFTRSKYGGMISYVGVRMLTDAERSARAEESSKDNEGSKHDSSNTAEGEF